MRFKHLLLTLLCSVNLLHAEWQSSDKLYDKPREGAFVGNHNGVYIIAGGSENGKILSEVTVIKEESKLHYSIDSSQKWQLPKKLAHGATVSTKDGMICIAGCTSNYISKDVYLIKWDEKKEALQIHQLPSLPIPMAYHSAAICENKIYVIGGVEKMEPLTANAKVYVYDLAYTSDRSWKSVGHLPMPFRKKALVVSQSNGLRENLYVFGGVSIESETEYKDSYAYDPTLKTWNHLSPIPHEYQFSSTCSASSNIILFGGNKVYAYHTVLEKWWVLKEMPAGSRFSMIETKGRECILGPNVSSGEIASTSILSYKPFGTLNHLILIGYFALLIGIGVFFSRKEKTTKDYFLASKRVPWWAAGMSIFGTVVSTLAYMSLPAKAFASDWQYAVLEMTLILAMPAIMYVFIPFYRKLNLVTSYQYLEKRFSIAVRLVGSLGFITYQLLRIGIILYIPAIVLELITGMSTSECIVIMGAVTIIYTVLGGIEAVIWADVIQSAILMIGLVFTLIYLFSCESVSANFFDLAFSTDKTRVVDLSMSLVRPTFWVVLIAGFFFDLMDYGCDQSTVQRYLTVKSTADARKSAWLNLVLCLTSAFFLLAIGTGLYAYYQMHPEKIDPTLNIVDGILGNFIIHEVPSGISGLITIGIFAAAMSSLDSGMNSVATTITVDFYQRFFPGASDRRSLRLARLVTVLVGLFGTVYALYLSKISIISLLDEYDTLVAFTLTAVSGLFLLGFFTKRANAKGAVAGYLLSYPLLSYVHYCTPLHFLLLMALSTIFVFILGYVASFFFQRENRDIYTVYGSNHTEVC